MRADDNLQLEVGKEESAVAHLVTERLVGVVVADGVRVRLGCTRERRRRGGGTLDGEGQPPRGVDGLCTEAAEVAEVDDES